MAEGLYTACVLTGPKQLELQQRSLKYLLGRIPPMGALVRIQAAGLCHSDVHRWHGYYSLGSSKKTTFEERGFGYPIVPGHEIAGRVHSLGLRLQSESAAAALKVGVRVVVYPWIGCGDCSDCKAGDTHLCPNPDQLGFNADGGFSEFVLVPHYR